jgi:hypothetical protein
MNGPLLFHLILGIAIVAVGGWMFKRRRRALGWTLTALGVVFVLMGVVHTYLHQLH